MQQVVVGWPRLYEVLQRRRKRIIAHVLNVAGADLLAFNDFDLVVVARLLNELAHLADQFLVYFDVVIAVGGASGRKVLNFFCSAHGDEALVCHSGLSSQLHIN